MNKTEKNIAQAAERFAKHWENRRYEVSEEQRERIAQTAQAILDARALYPDSSLADLYDPITMRANCRKPTATMTSSPTSSPSTPPSPTPQNKKQQATNRTTNKTNTRQIPINLKKRL